MLLPSLSPGLKWGYITVTSDALGFSASPNSRATREGYLCMSPLRSRETDSVADRSCDQS